MFTRVLVGRVAATAALGLMLSACSMGGMFGGGAAKPSASTQALQNATATPEQIAAMNPALPAIATECPPIKVRPGAEAAPDIRSIAGGQLLMHFENLVGTRGARIVLLDDPHHLRAAITAFWLRQLNQS